MDNYKLAQPQALELFVSIISKLEGREKSNILESLTTTLNDYKSSTISTEIATKVLKPIAAKNGYENYYPKFLSELSSALRRAKPVILTANRLSLLLEYVDKKDTIDRYQLAKGPEQKGNLLRDTEWWLYTYEYYKPKGSTAKKLAVGRFPVYLGVYGQVTIPTLEFHNGVSGKITEYQGAFYVKDIRYLFFDLHMGQTNEKELKTVFNIGYGPIGPNELVAGYYLNASRNIYFGPLILERTTLDKNATPVFFLDQDPTLDRQIWQYFSGLEEIPNELPNTVSGRFLDR